MENTSTAPVSTGSVGIRYGLITGLASILLSAVMFLTNTEQSPLRFFGYVILAAGIWMAHQFFKRNNGGFMSFGQGISIGTILSAITGVLSAIFFYVYVSFLDTGFMGRMVDNARAQMEASGKYSDEQMDQAMAMTQKFMSLPAFMGIAVVSTIIAGLIISLIVSAITKHTRPEFE
ncbi:DUF4199 domain-containing protein [Hymenobacter sp. CRA2]|uniref:DUF4199 domain-containing protein n=1 Tax=Hymenobacter sp. CRA2 TaxID=1955620 RepID=UPI00098F0C2E|nr:DUF4199 domain-containing protein [Hymenobacter sp. CRA2]OON68420.1 hypothetical protein B0919_12205 [Hymenobacter sp. CRA2]